MKTILGFGVFPGLANNNHKITNPIGELSPNSLTFSLDIGTYTNDQSAGTAFLSFTAVDDKGAAIVLTDAYKLPILSLQTWLLARISGGQFTNDKVIALQQIKADFGNVWNNITIGDMVTDGKHWSPEWFSGSLVGTNEENLVKIWFADHEFSLSYPRFSIRVEPPVPIANIDILHEDYDTAKAAIDGVSKGDLTIRINDIINKEPQTNIISMAFKIYDKLNKKMWQWGYFTCIGYGPGSANDDARYDALKDYILSNSKYTEDEWAEVIPDLFNPVEFIVVPDWLSYSIPGKTTQGALNSPIVKYTTATDLPIKVLKFWPSAHIQATGEAVPVLHKSLLLNMVGKPTNRDNTFSFRTLYPDYYLAPSDSPDFSHMSPATQDFVYWMQKMLIAAETMEEFSELPPDISRSIRDGVICAARTIGSIKFLVVSKPYIASLPKSK